MITIDQFVGIVGQSLFGGDIGAAGVVIFAVTLAAIFMVMKKNVFASLLLAIPTAFVYTMLGVLSSDMMVILIVICVLGLATTSKRALGE